MTILARGEWELADNKSLNMKCPACGMAFSMWKYIVRDDRTVFPDICCPDVKCRFIGPVELEGWEPRDAD
jgi:hypothetical protein